MKLIPKHLNTSPIILQNDATRVNMNHPLNLGYANNDDVQKALDSKIAAEGNMAYAVLRFVPYVKYATDVMDAMGVSPDLNGKPDWTDGGVIGKFGLNKYAKSMSDWNLLRARYARNANVYVSGTPTHITSMRNIPFGNGERVAQSLEHTSLAWSKVPKYNPLGLVNTTGDLKQGYDDFINLILAEQYWTNTLNRVRKQNAKKDPNTIKRK